MFTPLHVPGVFVHCIQTSLHPIAVRRAAPETATLKPMVLDGFRPIFSWQKRPTTPHWPYAASAVLASFVCGCGIAAAPQPPSLALPKPVHDLTAARSGSTVTIHWTTPRQTTDHVEITAPVQEQICQVIPPGTACKTVGTISGQPGKPAAFQQTLPAALETGPLRPSQYRVLALSARGRDAGPSNTAIAAAGAAPTTLQALGATNTRQGVVLHWVPLPANAAVSIRLERTLVQVSVPKPTAAARGVKASAAPAPVLLQVPVTANGQDPGQVLDTGTQFGNTYRYTGYRLLQDTTAHPPLRASSARSQPVEITPQDTFPPAAPSGLAAVPLAPAINGGQAAVDLSWSPDTSSDFGGYRVYRSEVGPASQPEVQVAPAPGAPALLAPAYHDTAVAAGSLYAYRVSAVNTAGVEGARSAAVRVEVPAGNAAPAPQPTEQP